MLAEIFIEIGVLIATFLLILFVALLILKKNKKSMPQEATVRKSITRKGLVNHVQGLKNRDITIVDKYPNNPQFPISLKWKHKVFAMLYAADEGVLLIVRIENSYASDVAKILLGKVFESSFPKGNNWFSILADNKVDVELVYKILENAKDFVQSKATLLKDDDEIENVITGQ